MQNILVAVDFSQPSNNAALYAAHLAEYFSAEIVLFNAFSLPTPYPESGVVFDEMEYKETSISSLNELKKLILEKNPTVDVSIKSVLGDAEISILQECNTGNYDLLVLGIARNNGKIREYLIGSTASAVAKKATVFTMIIPESYDYKKIKNIAFACDYNAELEKNLTLIKINYLVKAFNAKLFIFNIITMNIEFTIKAINREVYVDDKLAKISPEIVYSINDDVTEGLIDLVKGHDIDLLITYPQHHNYFYEWFKESNTKKLAFHSPIPLLSSN